MCSARQRSARHGARGFSLLEAVAATSFLALALMAFAANTISLTPNTSYVDPANPLQADGTAGGTFARRWVVSANNSPAPGLRTVSVTVTWRDTRLHTTTLASYVRCSAI